MTYYEHLFSSNKNRLLNTLNNQSNEIKNKIENHQETYNKYSNELAKENLSSLGSLGNHIDGALKGAYHLNPYEVVSNTAISAIDLVGVAADVVSAASSMISYAASQEKGTAVNAAFQALVYSTLLAGATFTVGAYVPTIAPAFNANNALKAVNIITKVSGATFGVVGSVKSAYYIVDAVFKTLTYSTLLAGATFTVGSYVPVIGLMFTNANNIVNAANIIAKLSAATFGVVDSVQTINYIIDNSAATAKSAFDTISNIADTASYVNTNLMHYVVEPLMNNPEVYEPVGVLAFYGMIYVGANILNITSDILGSTNFYDAAFNFAVA
jgi:hypothetical protein